jgi:DNA-binding MarR family transcriptional regulator
MVFSLLSGHKWLYVSKVSVTLAWPSRALSGKPLRKARTEKGTLPRTRPSVRQASAGAGTQAVGPYDRMRWLEEVNLQHDLTKMQARVLLVLAKAGAGDRNKRAKVHQSWFSLKTIAKRTGSQPAQVGRYMTTLARHGLISREARDNPNSSWLTTVHFETQGHARCGECAKPN